METSDNILNCANCESFDYSTFDQSSCKHPDRDKTQRNQLCLCEDFKDYKESRYDEIHEENKDNLKVQSDWIYYVELVNNSVGKNCPL